MSRKSLKLARTLEQASARKSFRRTDKGGVTVIRDIIRAPEVARAAITPKNAGPKFLARLANA